MKKIYFFRAILAVILLAGFNQALAQVSTVTITTVGNTTWTCPTGVTTVTVECWGGGGGGGGVATASNTASGGGAGGSYTTNTVTVVPGTTYTVTVGAGGAGGTTAGTNGSAGGSSSFDGTTVVAVGGPGGQGGTAAGSYTAGLGTTTGNTAGTNFAGGNGASGASTTIGGGGGGGAGNANPGGNAAGSTAGTGGTVGGGNGGAGQSNATGSAGTAPGGGGGGTRRANFNRAGGAGARGQVTLSYVNPAPTIEAFPDQVFCTNTYPTAYNTVNFSLVETSATNFDASQTTQTLILTLPAGFEFNTAAGPSIVRNTAPGATQDITIGTFTITTSSITVNLTTNGANAGLDEINFLNFQIRAITGGASGDLVRSGGTFKVNGSTSVPSNTTSFGHLSTSTPSVYNSSSVSQYSTANVIRGCTSDPSPILEFQVNVTGGYCNPNDVITQFVFSTAGNPGSTNPATDITSAVVYYSDTTGGFSNANFFGSVANPSGTFTITGSQALDLGTGPYYFYLAYTVPATATAGDVLDASMTSFTFNGTVITSMTTPDPAGSRPIVAGTCPSAPDLVPPTVNMQNIPAGSLIIPMDNTHQALVTPFNLKAYGLVHELLQNDIPVKWIIKSGKTKDAVDFSASVSAAYPTSSTVTTTENFVASAFVVDSFYLTHSYYSGGQTATQVMTSFAVTNNVRVYKLMADVSVDVRYTLSHRPKLAVFSNGGYETIQTDMLDAAGITNYFVQDAGDFTGLAECYTFCSESHWDYSSNPDTRPVQRVVDFVNEGGNFLAQCAGIDLYENHQPLGGHFQTTQGISYPGSITALGSANLANYNPDMAFAQYQGNVTSQGGRIPYFYPATSSVIKPETFAALARTTSTNTMVATAVHLGNPDSTGYNVFYLAGHDYTGTGITDYNGYRIYLNATLIPAGRPTAFPITITSTPTICAGQSVSIGPVCAPGATYAWSPSTGLNTTTSCNPVASPTVTTAYTVVGFNGGCIMGPTTMTVNVNPTPVMTSTNSATICGNGTVNIPLTSNLTSTYTWIAADNPNTTGESITTQTTSALNNTIVNTSTVTQTVIYTVTPTSTTGTCTGTPQTVTVTVSPAPTMTSAGTATICSGAAVNIPLTANIAGSTFTWIATDNPGTTGESITSQSTATLNNTITNNTATAQTVVYTVTPTAGGCLGTAQTVSVTVNPTPSATATPNSQTICSAGTTSISLSSGVGGTTYSWTVSQSGTSGASNSSGSSITQTLTATGVTAGTATYSITPSSGGCSGTPITVPITVNPIPSATATPSSQSICSGGATSVALTSNVSGSTFAWSVTQTNVSGGSNSSGTSIAQTLTATGTSAGTAVYTITPTAGTCPGIPITATITVNPIPTVTASPVSQSICSGGTTTVTLNGNVSGTTYSWTVTQTNVSGASVSSGTLIAQTLTATSTSIGTAVYTITPTASSCSGSPVTVTVTVNPAPSATATPTSQSICSGGTTTVTLSSSTGGATFNWAVNQTNVTGASAGTGTVISQALTASTSNAGTAVYTITPSAGGCAGTPVTTTVTVNPIPTVTASTTSQSICSNNTTTVTLSSSTTGATFNWTVGQTNVTGATAGSGTLIAQTLTATTSSAGTAVYTITPSAGTCAGTAITVTVTVNPAPSATATPNSQSICSGTATSIALSSSTGGATFAWTVSQTNVSGASNSSGASIAQTLNATTASNGTAVYTITPSAGGCAGTPVTATVTVKPIPTVTVNPATQSLCSGATTTVSLSSSTGGTTFAWTVSQANVSGASNSSGASIAQTLTATANTAGTAVYTITPTASSCSGSPVTATITVNPIPSATATPGAESFCSGGTSSIALSSNVAGTTFTWTVAQSGVSGAAGGSGSSIAQTLNTTGAASGTAIYTITPSASACGGTPITATVTVNPAPVMTSASTATICSGGTVNIPLTANVASGFTWLAADNVNTTGESTTTQSTSTLNNTITNSTTSAQNVIYTVTPTSTAGTCAGTPQTVTVTVNPVPAMTSASTATICSGGGVSIAFTSNVASTYTWIAANNANTTGESITTQTTSVLSNTITNTTASVQNVIYTVTPTSSAGVCAGTSQTVTVTVNPTPAMTSASTATICSGASVNIPLTANVASAFTWVAANNANTTGESTTVQNTSAINDAITNTTATVQTVVYTVTPTSTGGSCTGSPQTVSVTVNPTPAMTSVNSATICSGGTVSIPLTSNVASTYSWIAADNPNTTGESTTTQTTNTLSNTIVSTTGNTEVVVYTVTPTSSGGTCAGAAQTVSVTVSPTPIATATPNSQTLCSGNATSIALSSNVSGTTFNWTVSQSSASGASAGSGTSITQTITATAVTAGTVIYTITPVVGSCSGTTTTATVTVNPVPVMTVTPASQSICSGNATAVTFTSNVAGTTYSWTVSQTGVSGAANGSGSSITQTLTATGTSQGTAVYTITPTAGTCSGTSSVVTVSVNPIPTLTATPSSQSFCSGGATSVALSSNVTGATYSWTVAQSGVSGASNGSGSAITQTLTTTGTSPGTATYTITPAAGTCNGTPVVVTVTVNPIPAAPTASSNSPVCLTNSINLSAGTVSGATYNWSGPNSFSSSSQNPSISNASFTDAGTYSVNVTVNGCTGPTQTVSVVVNTPPPATLSPSSNSPVCTGQTLNLSIGTITSGSYSWSGPNTFTSSAQNPSIGGVTSAAAGTYTINVTVPGCAASGTGTVAVVVNPTPAAPGATNNGPLCAGDNLNLTATGTGTTYSWTGPASYTSTTQNPAITNVTAANAGVYSVTTTANGCTSTAGTTTVVVNPIPATPSASSNSPLCIGQNLNLSTPTVSGATYSWSGPNSFSSSTQNPGVNNVSAADAGTYSITITVNGCTSAAGTVVVNVNSSPATPTATANSPVCTGDTLFLTASGVGGASFSWTGPNGFTSGSQNPFVAPVTAAAAGTYTVIANNGCASTPATVSVTVNVKPSSPTPGNNSPVCQGSTLNLTASAVGGATYSWTGPNGFSSSLQNPSVTNVGSADAGTYSVTVTLNGCTSTFTTTAVTVDVPAVASTSGSQTVCANNSPVAIAGTVSGGSSTGTWSTNGSGAFTPSATAMTVTYTPSNADTAAGSVVLTLTSSNNGSCAAAVSTLTVTITDAPVAFAGADQTVCANNASVVLGGSVSGGATGGTWTTSGSGTFSPDANTLNATYVPSTADTTAGIVTFTLTTTGIGQCLATTDQMTLTITNAPTVNAGPDQIKCKSSINTALNGTVTVINSGTWTTLGSGTFTPNANTLNATYVPSAADTSAGSVLLVLTSANVGGCTPTSDTMKISFTDIPQVNAGLSQTVCGNNAVVALNGSVTVGSTTGIWSSTGTGTFTPNNTTLNGNYVPSNADTAAGSVILTLTSTGGCVVVQDSLTVTITDAPLAYAGNDLSVCSNNPNAAISGMVSGATTTGIWSTTGSGTFNPSSTSLSATYVPSGSDISGGSVFLILTSTNNNNCNAAIDSLKLTFTPPPAAFAGNDTSFCANASMTLGGVITGGNGTGSWTTTGSGTFAPNANTLNATYTPSAADTAAGSVTLTLTSTNNGGCLAATDQVVLTITDGPGIFAGSNQVVCSNNNVVALNGQVTVSTGIQWSTTGDGTFGSATSSSTTYTPGTTDISNGTVTIVAASTGNGGCNVVTDTMLVQIDQAPVVNAGGNQFICSGVGSANVSGTITGVTTTGTWTTLGSGSFTSPNSLSTTYSLSPADTLAGSVTLVLTSTNNGTSCNPSSDTVVIMITPAGYASAGNDTTVCSNVTSIGLSGAVTGGTGAGQWSTSGTGTFTPNDTALNASYTPSAADISAGNVTIKLTPVNSCMPSADSLVLTLAPAPVVNAGSNVFVCATTNTVALNGSVSGGATTGTWSTLGSGSFSPNANTLNAVYTLSQADSAAGSIDLILTSTGSGVCGPVADTVNITLTTTAMASAGNDTTICSSAGSIILSGVINGGAGVGVWTTSGTGTFTPNDSALNASYTPSAADISSGTVHLTLTPYNACQPSADSLVLTIAPAPVADAGTDLFICTTTNTVALNGSVTGGATTGTWTTLGSGTFAPNASTLNAVYTLSTADSTAGSVMLVLTSANTAFCGAMSDTVKITTTTATSALAGADTSICSNDSLALGGVINGGSTGQWTSNGSGTFSPSGTTLNAYYVPSAADISNGSVILTLTPTTGCQPAADSLTLSFNAAPVVSAGTSTVICASTNTVALNGSVSGGSTTGNWTTNGSGTFSPSATALNGTYTLSQADSLAGSVTLVLTSTNNGSCGASKDSITITISTPASAVAGANVTVCGNNSLVSLGGAINGGTGQGQWSSSGSGVFTPADTSLNASYAPSGADIANGSVVLTLTPLNACAPTADSLTVTITPSPTVSAGPDTSICGGPISLNGSINAVPTGAVWTSNGTGAFTPNDSALSATYTPAAGDNDTLVFVLTTSGNGQCNAVTDTVRIIRGVQPAANFVFSNLCQNQAVAFTDSTVGTVLSWSWSFGNGDTSAVQSPAYTYTASGTYTVSLHVSAGTGCGDSVSKVVNVNPAPAASFTLASACFNDSVHFVNTSTLSQGTLTSWNWGFGDGNSSSQQSPSHLYDSVKVYTVTLAVTSDSGCTSTATNTVAVKSGPLAGFTTASGCGSMIVSFTDTSSVASPDSVISWNWSFGNGSTSTQHNPSNTYTTTGTYTVLLQVQTASGCADTASAVINLGQNVIADYIPAGGTYNTGQNIVFTNQSTGASGYNWTFGNGDTSAVTNPSYTYTQPGTYTVVLVASNLVGCLDTVEYVFEVNTHGVTVPTGFTPNGDGLNDYFYVMGGPFSSYELRVFNEWGNQIFLSNAQSDKWDGTIGGTKQPAGTYIYIFNGKTADGQTIKLQKEINLIR